MMALLGFLLAVFALGAEALPEPHQLNSWQNMWVTWVVVSRGSAIRAINGGDHETSAEEFTNRVFNKIDVNGDGELSLNEFVEGARKDDEFMEVMMKSLDLSHIVAMINNRRHSV